MNKIKYFFQFIIIIFIFSIFKILGLKISSFIGGKLFQIIGPVFRSKNFMSNKIEFISSRLEVLNEEKLFKALSKIYEQN